MERKIFIKIQGPGTLLNVACNPSLFPIYVLISKIRHRLHMEGSFETPITSITAFLGYPRMKKPREKVTVLRLFWCLSPNDSIFCSASTVLGLLEPSSGSSRIILGRSQVTEAGQTFHLSFLPIQEHCSSFLQHNS